MSSVGLTGTGQFLGTPDYAAPEQIQGRAVDGRADQYALACVAFQLLTGAVPFERDQGMAVLLAHLSEPPPSLVERRPDLPAAADQVLARALAKVPEERYGSCREFADALREALGLPPYTTPAPAAPGHPRTEVAVSSPGWPGPVAAAAGTAAGPADLPADARAAAGRQFPGNGRGCSASQPERSARQAGWPWNRTRRRQLRTGAGAAGRPGHQASPGPDPGPGHDGARPAQRAGGSPPA